MIAKAKLQFARKLDKLFARGTSAKLRPVVLNCDATDNCELIRIHTIETN